METRRWLNQSHPQTLYMANILLYFAAALGVLFGAIFRPIGFLYVVGFAAGGFGIANDKRWGYYLAVAIAALEVAWIAIGVALDPGVIFSLLFLLNSIFPIALFLLLIHPHSREHQRIWFE